jgi:hypothetical protein
MDLDEIKRGLRAEIKKRENEQYFTFQCNVRQMCKDVLATLEEQESVIAELKADYKEACGRLQTANLIKDEQLAATRHHKYKRCLAMARWCERKRIDAANYRTPRQKWDFYDKWYKRWLELAEKFKEAK